MPPWEGAAPSAPPRPSESVPTYGRAASPFAAVVTRGKCRNCLVRRPDPWPPPFRPGETRATASGGPSVCSAIIGGVRRRTEQSPQSPPQVSLSTRSQVLVPGPRSLVITSPVASPRSRPLGAASPALTASFTLTWPGRCRNSHPHRPCTRR